MLAESTIRRELRILQKAAAGNPHRLDAAQYDVLWRSVHTLQWVLFRRGRKPSEWLAEQLVADS